MGGSSTGTLVAGAIKWCQKQKEPKKVVTFICDTGNKYLSKAFNKSFLSIEISFGSLKFHEKLYEKFYETFYEKFYEKFS